VPVPEDLVTEDAEAVQWALATLKLLNQSEDSADVVVAEEALAAEVPVTGIKAGTMDACCPTQGWLADFKTGQMRDYEAQMAAYSLACMNEYWSDEWTAHLLFVDQQRVVSRHFTWREARDIVYRILNAPEVPSCCEYCGWCGAFERCSAVKAAADAVVADELPACTPAAKSRQELPEVMAAMVEDEAAAHAFLSKLKVVNDWAEVLRAKLKEKLAAAGGESEFFRRGVVSGRRVVNPLALSRYAMELGTQRLLGMCSAIPLKKVEEQWAEVFHGKPVPEELITTQGGVVSLTLKKLKKNIGNN
jgi:hypothetical protein